MAISLNESETGDKGEVFRDVPLVIRPDVRAPVSWSPWCMKWNVGHRRRNGRFTVSRPFASASAWVFPPLSNGSGI